MIDSPGQIKRALYQLATGFRISSVLFAALELDVFAHIPDEGATAERVAAKLGLALQPVRLLLSTLTAMGVLSARDGRYRIVAELASCFRPGDDYLGESLLSHKHENEHWLHMAEILRGSYEGARFEDTMLAGKNVPYYLASIAQNNRPHANAMWAHLEGLIPKLNSVLDIGGGHGYFAERLLELDHRVTVTVLDLQDAIAFCRQRLGETPRLTLEAGDALAHDHHDEFDLVMCNDLLHYFSHDQKREVLRRAVRALHPGGTLAIAKMRLDATGTEPGGSTLFSLRMFVGTHRAYLETDDELVSLLRECGLANISTVPLDTANSKTLVTGVA